MFCKNCGKQIPERESKLCDACTAQLYGQPAQPGAQPQQQTYTQPQEPVYAQPVYASATQAAAPRRTMRTRLILIAALVVVAALVITVVTLVLTRSGSGSSEDRLIGGVASLISGNGGEPAAPYTHTSLLQNLAAETQGVARAGSTDIRLAVIRPDGAEAALNLGLQTDGGRALLSLDGEADGEQLATSYLYLDAAQLGVCLLGSEQWYGVTVEDLLASLEQNGYVPGDMTDELSRQLSALLEDTDLQAMAEAVAQILRDALPADQIVRESATFNGERCTVYTLSLDGDDGIDFLCNVLQGIVDNRSLSDQLLTLVNTTLSAYTQAAGQQLTRDDLQDMVDALTDQLAYAVLFDSLELSVYYDGNTPIGLELDVRDLLSELSRLRLHYSLDRGEETVRSLEVSARDAYGGTYALELTGTHSGTVDDSTDVLRIRALEDGNALFEAETVLYHVVEGNVTTDTLEYQLDASTRFVLSHVLTGNPSDDRYSSELRLDVEMGGETASIVLSIDKQPGASIETPEMEIVSDGSLEYFNYDKLDAAYAELEPALYQVERFLRQLELFFSSSSTAYAY